MIRRDFLIGLFCGSALTTPVALIALRVQTPEEPPSPQRTQFVVASPDQARTSLEIEPAVPPDSPKPYFNKPADENDPEPDAAVPADALKRYFNGVPYYIVPLQSEVSP